jgi:DNA repair exonuclease SbcCD ATPase subunit
MTLDKIIKNLAQVKVEIGKAVDALEHNLTEEYRKLSDMQEAIRIESRNLEEMHNIKMNADSLSALLMAQKEYKQRFEDEMCAKKTAFDGEVSELRDAWEKEQETYAQSKKELDAKNKKERMREEEEYSYNLQLERKKDQDSYDARKSLMEKDLEEKRETVLRDLAQREAAIKNQEDEFKLLKNQVSQFPSELEKTVKEREKITTENLEKHYKHQIDLSSKDIDGERKLNQQTIASLQAKIKEQESFIKQLTQKADDATIQVQSIAIKALEGTSSMRFYPGHDESKKQSQSA